MSLLLLVRHGQASWGAADYDNLSPLGTEQSALLGRHLASLGVEPVRLWVGGMRRHQQTADAAREAAGWAVEPEVDEGWAEFDHVRLLEAHGDAPDAHGMPITDFNVLFDAAIRRWTGGEHATDYDEPFSAFSDRVDAVVRRAAEQLGKGETGVVFTSGGPIAWAASRLLGAGTEQWGRLNPVQVNTGYSRLVTGSRGVSLVSLNEQSHLTTETLTYR
ncbi:histidine phosphatase family protein [Nocardioides marmoribigeumensis]|uniref:Broad specificity phosphatase PhoE n=1 Tax=Nocardioides marmoribigeumensis TaxID=433649 RepID=A0ABU2BWR0_9ACTN|nr:histidine phosphatase family protein [Nocardioides marmoribigeumensis]MDR7362729.1 broad specificity phosphatase PhoE [Nocardioides marmoribigeumensis]